MNGLLNDVDNSSLTVWTGSGSQGVSKTDQQQILNGLNPTRPSDIFVDMLVWPDEFWSDNYNMFRFLV